ncbi:MAG: pseudouridine synthase [Bacillota bacterium]|nr:pseudouridine synthase [Bacillota bacterium]
MNERLQKYMARCGVASRRKCEELISSGAVAINNIIVKELGTKIDSDADVVTVSGKKIEPEKEKVYIALNKPEGYVSTVKDEKNRPTIIDIIKVKERVYPIGRLDYDTSGLILLTNDGNIYNRIIHPRNNIDKAYIAIIEGYPSPEEIEHFQNGVNLDGYITAPSKFKIIAQGSKKTRVEITIHEGKNRQVRRMCSAINHEVINLQRIRIGKIKLENLPKGKWRFLTEEEINYLKKL